MVFINTSLYYIQRFWEHIFERILHYIRKDDYWLTEDKYEHIKKCANSAYPDETFFVYNDYDTMTDFIKAMNCSGIGQLYVVVGEEWYFIAIRHLTFYVGYDFAAIDGKCSDIFKIIGIVNHLFKGKTMYMMCRENTSYRLFKAYERMNKCRIKKDEIKEYNGETNHILKVKFL